MLEWIACRLPARVLPDHLDVTGLGAVALMLGGLAWRAARNLRVLAEREPYAA